LGGAKVGGWVVAIGGLHRPKEQLQLLHRYAIAGQDAQHLDEQI